MESTTRERVPWFFSREDEKCFFTYAQYVEPLTSIAVKIYDIQNAISLWILHTWGLRISPGSLQLWFEDPHGQHHCLNQEDALYQILGAYHPLWFCAHLPFGFERYRVSPFCPCVLRPSCCSQWPFISTRKSDCQLASQCFIHYMCMLLYLPQFHNDQTGFPVCRVAIPSRSQHGVARHWHAHRWSP